MKKKKKAVTIILIVFILVFGVIFGGYFAIKTVMTKGAINYLQDKYNISYNQITVLDYEMKKPGNDTSFLLLNKYWSPYKWELEYNNKSFFVNRIDGKYYDDYQLDEIESVATEYINNFKKRYYDLYHANNTAIYLHKNDLTIHFGYDFYGIDLNKVSYAEKSCMIVEKYYD